MKKVLPALLALTALLVVTGVWAIQPRAEVSPEIPEAPSAAEVVRLTRFQGKKITGVSTGGAFQVEVVKVADDSQNRAVVEIDADLEPYLELEIDAEGVVRLGWKRTDQTLFRSGRNRTMKMTLYLNELSRVTLAGSGSISVPDPNTTFTGTKITARVTGSGRIRNLVFRGDSAEIESTGSGSVHMTTYTREIYAKGSGSGRSDLTCYDTEYAKVTVSGSGGITIRGEAQRADLSSSGSGTLRGDEFKVKRANARAVGSGGIRIWAEESLEGSVSGSGGLRYKGNPRQLNVSKSGSGSVRTL